ncbi:MAG: UDP-3-O-(3-hydroxymyristoyl)glucosamine N-acyltransferase [Alphaproteobacteria bacterium CG_4_10_14_0_2_um_filter_63_37]|nr:MAG: UDP-3-O-(3-hydroxymyristoyl)glucosamine N-acyltransferase [Proteobacteria bacterium CG1_02_64_396]PJA23790.1 MAG: UDP-3-O-(3-hydroxymyristoyl)glucosamine N-acyltransferase [Alphaproteobacteria bacterium CG_4_10_14_0_2_um_filter_63_37]
MARLSDLAQVCGGRLEGDDIEVVGVAPLDSAKPDQLSFLSDAGYLVQAAASRAGALVWPSKVSARPDPRPVILHPNPPLAIARILAHLHPEPAWLPGIAPQAVVDPSAKIDPSAHIEALAWIGPGVVVGAGSVIGPGVVLEAGVKVGGDCRLWGNVVVRHGCILGDRVIVQPGAVIGSDGFGYARDGVRQVLIPQVGRVILEDEVEVGAGTAIDRGALEDTVVKQGTKIDNLVQVGHNCIVGPHATICGQAGLAGSSIVGANVTLAAQSGVAGHLEIGAGVVVAARGGVTKSIEQPGYYAGFPAQPVAEWRKEVAAQRRIPELRSALRTLSQRVAALEQEFHELEHAETNNGD